MNIALNPNLNNMPIVGTDPFMNDEDFCQAMGYRNGIKRDLAKKIRDLTGELCKVDPNAITPNEDTEKLNSRMPDGLDDVEFLMKLESALGFLLDVARLPNFSVSRFFFLYKKAKPLNYGEWVKNVVEMLAPIVAAHLEKK